MLLTSGIIGHTTPLTPGYEWSYNTVALGSAKTHRSRHGGHAMKQRLGLLCAIFTIVSLFLAVGPLAAQEFRGSVSGTVSDTTGAVLPGVTVTVKNMETNVPAVVVTDSRGFYKVPYLNSGSYSIEASLDGFRPAIRKSIPVRVGDAVAIDFKLEPGGV